MAWYNPSTWWREKANPAQGLIAQEEGSSVDTREMPLAYTFYYEKLEIVNRAVNLIVDDVADIPFRVGDSRKGLKVVPGIRKDKVDTLLNFSPNPDQDVSSFKRNLVIDLLLDGNVFIYFDGAGLFHLPANKVRVIPSEISYVKEYIYDERETFLPSEIIHIKENSFHSIYRGIPRLKPATRSMKLLKDMRDFQEQFFKNGAVPGLIIKTPHTLSERIKERTLANWKQRYNPKSGGFNPMILDGGTEIDTVNDIDFRKMAFQESIVANEKIILQALGIPHILFEGGNNANIRPNHRLYYLETIIPIIRKFNSAFSRFFGYEITEDIKNIPALQPELREQADFYSTLVNGGILVGNEARVGLGKDPLDDESMDKIRIPQNIAGSAVNPAVGGRPEGDNE